MNVGIVTGLLARTEFQTILNMWNESPGFPLEHRTRVLVLRQHWYELLNTVQFHGHWVRFIISTGAWHHAAKQSWTL